MPYYCYILNGPKLLCLCWIICIIPVYWYSRHFIILCIKHYVFYDAIYPLLHFIKYQNIWYVSFIWKTANEYSHCVSTCTHSVWPQYWDHQLGSSWTLNPLRLNCENVGKPPWAIFENYCSVDLSGSNGHWNSVEFDLWLPLFNEELLTVKLHDVKVTLNVELENENYVFFGVSREGIPFTS